MYGVTETEMLAKLYRPAFGEDEGSFASFTVAARALVPATVARVLHPDPAAPLGIGPPALGIGPPALGIGPPALGIGPPAAPAQSKSAKLRRLCDMY